MITAWRPSGGASHLIANSLQTQPDSELEMSFTPGHTRQLINATLVSCRVAAGVQDHQEFSKNGEKWQAVGTAGVTSVGLGVTRVAGEEVEAPGRPAVDVSLAPDTHPALPTFITLLIVLRAAIFKP